MYRYLKGLELIDFTKKTAIGSLSNYISTFNVDFQPMNVNFGIFEELVGRGKIMRPAYKNICDRKGYKTINER
jgi:methylenetetrahydrofolate--tRNA-(uracil-5-)-methyltransferase